MSNRHVFPSLRVASVLKLTAGFVVAMAGQMLSFAQVQGKDGNFLPTLMQVREFAENPSLTAQAGQALVFTLDEAETIGRFDLPEGTHQFCLEGGAGYFTSINLQASDGQTISLSPDRNGCARVHLQQGMVSVRLGHGDGPGPPDWVTAAVRADPLVADASATPAPLVGPDNSPVGGYWAIQDNTFNARGTFGNRILSTTPGNNSQILVDPSTVFDGLSLWQFPPISGQYLPALLGSQPNLWSLFASLPYVVSTCGFYCGNAYGPPPNLQIKDLGNYQFVFNIYPPNLNLGLYGNTSGGVTVLAVTLGGVPADTFQVLFRFFPDGTQIGSLNDGEVAIYQACDLAGRAAVFIPLQGVGVVSGPYNLTALTSSATTLDGTGKSVQIGKGSSIYWGSSPTNVQGAVVSNTSCLPAGPSGQLFVEPVSNTLVVAHDLLHNSCVNCVLAGQTLSLTPGAPAANFSSWNFSGADFSGSVLANLNLSGANLSGAKFIGATLTDVDLSGSQVSSNGLDFTGATLTRVKFNGVDINNCNFSKATLSNIDFSSAQFTSGTLNFTGATMNQVNLSGVSPAALTAVGATLCGVSLTGSANNMLDLTSGNFANVRVTLSSSCAANLSFTKLTANQVPGAQWTGFNFTGTVITGLEGQVLSTKTAPLDFTGVGITGMSLQGVGLDYAEGLAGRDLTQVQFNNSSLRYVDLSKAKLYGAKLVNTNLEGANMSGVFLTKAPSQNISAANLSGAFLRNVNLSQSQLSGANFANANFYSQAAVGPGLCTPDPQTGFTTGCATAAGSTMYETVFNSAYLFGVDFTNTTAQGVNFGNAFLTGSNFHGATLTASSDGTDTGFSGAFLQGVNMAGLTLQNNVSLQNAFVDFMPTNVITLKLNGDHTTFAGYWSTPGEQVCAQMTYNAPTTIPVTNGQITCPDGNQYTNGCGPAAPDGSNGRWKSQVDITAQASYQNDSTYTKAPASGNPICTADLKWVPISFGEPPPRRRPPRHRRKHH